jgi:hypothetical protein
LEWVGDGVDTHTTNAQQTYRQEYRVDTPQHKTKHIYTNVTKEREKNTDQKEWVAKQAKR